LIPRGAAEADRGGGAEADDDQIPDRRRDGSLVVCTLARRQCRTDMPPSLRQRHFCDNDTCVSRCAQRSDSDVIVREREHWRHHDRGFDIAAPAGDVVIRR
jgi:hypothetical protein